MPLTKIVRRPGKTPPPPPPGTFEADFADIEAEVALSLKLCSRGLGLAPERVLTIVGRIINQERPGKTVAEVLRLYKRHPALFWDDVKDLAGRDGNGCELEEEE